MLTEIVQPAEDHTDGRLVPGARIALGFHAGGALSLRLRADELDELRRRCAGEAGFREIEAEDGAVLVNLGQVIYLRIESRRAARRLWSGLTRSGATRRERRRAARRCDGGCGGVRAWHQRASTCRVYRASARWRTTRAEAAVRALLALGEHGAMWLAIGAAGCGRRPPPRARWRARRVTVGVAYVLDTSIKLVVGRRARPSRTCRS